MHSAIVGTVCTGAGLGITWALKGLVEDWFRGDGTLHKRKREPDLLTVTRHEKDHEKNIKGISQRLDDGDKKFLQLTESIHNLIERIDKLFELIAERTLQR
jgi:hypothetical protein